MIAPFRGSHFFGERNEALRISRAPRFVSEGIRHLPELAQELDAPPTAVPGGLVRRQRHARHTPIACRYVAQAFCYDAIVF